MPVLSGRDRAAGPLASLLDVLPVFAPTDS
jgi:hypothetical protein